MTEAAAESDTSRHTLARQAADRAETILDAIVTATGGRHRDGQVSMTREVAGCLVMGWPALVQGGTGTGKSLAYLAGALGAGKRTVIATHTKALQDQLLGDLRLLSDVLDGSDLVAHPPRYALVKGRANYVCLSRLAPTDQDALDIPAQTGGGGGGGDSLGDQVLRLREWAASTDTGDRADVPFDVHGKAWEQVSVTTDNCAGKRCPYYGPCFAEQAKRNAAEADIVVLNQALLAMGLRFPLLPDGAEAIIVDEAHEFDTVVAETFGAHVTADRMRQAVKRCGALDVLGAENAQKLRENATGSIAEFEEDVTVPTEPDREAITTPALQTAVTRCRGTFSTLLHRAEMLPEDDDEQAGTKEQLQRLLDNLLNDLALVQEGSSATQVAWVEPRRDTAVLRSARFDVSGLLRDRLLNAFGSVVFTSATLTVAGTFDAAARTFGFDELSAWRGTIVSSPFDYRAQGRVLLPPGLPQPNTAEFTAAVAQTAVDVAEAAGGRTLVLCTSWRAVRAIGEALQEHLGDRYQVLVQEPGVPSRSIADAFTADPRAVLVGTRTFWTGVSIDGDTCTAVVLDKVPFPTPSEPITAARAEAADARAGNGAGFREVSLAAACLTITQGAGRLIRTVTDRGVVVICDPRVNQANRNYKFYGRTILRSLPPMPVTSDKPAVLEFLRDIDAHARATNPTGGHHQPVSV